MPSFGLEDYTGSGYNDKILASHSPGFNFMTADAATAPKMEISLYTNPLELAVWLCVFGSSLVAAIALSSEVFSSGLERKTGFEVLFDLFAALVEQNWDTGKIYSATFKSKLRILIIVSWLLSGIIISNGYKGLLKTLFSTRNQYTTKWERLDQIQDFTWYLPAGRDNLSGTGVWFTTNNDDDTSWSSCNEGLAKPYKHVDNTVSVYSQARVSKERQNNEYPGPRQFR
ncbi:unnamed protein product, partial [Allacma fusca]